MLKLHAPQPVIAKVQGTAAAVCQLVAACDLAIASDVAQFATPGEGRVSAPRRWCR
jgi:enoyl-CoA hydratase/carnithine racemase